MKKLFTLLILSFALAYATQTLKPAKEIHIDGAAKDIVVRGDILYIGTDKGKMQAYDYKTDKFVDEVQFPNIKDFMGDTISTRVASLDCLDSRCVMVTDSGVGGYINLWLYENNTTTRLLTEKDKRSIIKVRFVDKDHLLFGYLSNEAALFDIKSKKEIYKVQLTESKFSDFALNNDKSRAAFGCESGEITVIDVKSGKIIKRLKGVNKDNVYKVDYKNAIVSGAGQDRRGSIYDITTGRGTAIEGKFLIYATGLSADAKEVAFAIDEENDIAIYNTNTKSKLFLLKGQKSTLNAILFIDKKTIVSASDDDTVMLWRLP